MNKRIISSILTNKFRSFLNSIKDEKVKKLVDENSIITGGAIASLLLKEEVNDYDIYFTNLETTEAVARYYVDKFNINHVGKKVIKPEVYLDEDRVRIKIQSIGYTSENVEDNEIQNILEEGDDLPFKVEKDDQKAKYRPIFLTDNAITLSDDIQIIVRFYGSVKEIHENYDYVHCINYWESANKHLTLKKAALESLLNKELYYQGSLYPLCSLIRMRKFIKRGWHINAGQILKMAWQVSDLNLRNMKVLEDQLVGVDTAYFIQLIDQIKRDLEANPKMDVSMPYIVSLIDKIF